MVTGRGIFTDESDADVIIRMAFTRHRTAMLNQTPYTIQLLIGIVTTQMPRHRHHERNQLTDITFSVEVKPGTGSRHADQVRGFLPKSFLILFGFDDR